MPRLRTFHRASQMSVIIDNPHTFYSTDYRPVRSMCFFSFIDKNSTSRRYSVEEILTHTCRAEFKHHFCVRKYYRRDIGKEGKFD